MDYIIKEENYQGLINLLEAKKLPKSVNILLYGAPGTGKTEMVYQLAKANNREVIRINISDVKSKWFGDSEKMIKRIFSDYRDYAKGKKIKPILLFNEADGVNLDIIYNKIQREYEPRFVMIFKDDEKNKMVVLFSPVNTRLEDSYFEVRNFTKIIK